MERKQYLRGLGLGLIVASLVTAVGSKQTMSDEQVKARAMDLGMVEGKTYLLEAESEDVEAAAAGAGLSGVESLESAAGETESLEKETLEKEASEKNTLESEASQSEVVEPETSQSETSEQEGAEAGNPESADSESESAEPETPEAESKEPSGADAVTFQIKSGDSSVSVSNRLKEAGIVADARAFDAFLCQNGYDKRIRAGIYQIEKGATQRRIAEMITGGN